MSPVPCLSTPQFPITPPNSDHVTQSQAVAGKASRDTHVLEGSVRVAHGPVRVCLPLIDVAAGCVSWCEQVDRQGGAGIAGQENLAQAVCFALQHCFGRDSGTGGA